jgi:D-alanine-D-alanine ligase
MGYSEEETAEFDRDDTITAIESALQNLGYTTDRIGNGWQLAERLVKGDRWDLVFNIAEGLRGISRESQVPALLDLYGIPYTFSDPVITGLTLHKAMTKHVIRDNGLPTPDFMIVKSPSDAVEISFPPPYFIKPLAEGTGKGVTAKSIVRDKKLISKRCEDLLKQFHQPVLVEKYVSGREFTVGIVGTGMDARVLGTMEIILLPQAETEVYSYINKEQCEELVEYKKVSAADDPIVKESENVALNSWNALECRDAGRVDLRCDEKGNPYFLEVNPLSGLHPLHSDLPILCTHLGISYINLIKEIVTSALKRVNKDQKPGRTRTH